MIHLQEFPEMAKNSRDREQLSGCQEPAVKEMLYI